MHSIHSSPRKMAHEAESTYALEIFIGRVRSKLLPVSPCVAVRLLDFPTVVMRCNKQTSDGSVSFDQGYVFFFFLPVAFFLFIGKSVSDEGIPQRRPSLFSRGASRRVVGFALE